MTSKIYADIDYLIIGHLTVDLVPSEHNDKAVMQLGGTAAYAALTARAMGKRVGIVSGWGNELPLDSLDGIQLCLLPAKKSTTFENIYLDEGRKQIVHAVADSICFSDIPNEWRNVPLVHFAPLVNEVDESLIDKFSESFRCLTPQGWMRIWDEKGVVSPYKWKNKVILRLVDAIVLSVEDVQNNQSYIRFLKRNTALLILTHGKNGAVVYNKGKKTVSPAGSFEENDPTGAGDIFAASFFSSYASGLEIEKALEIAHLVAGYSVTKKGMQSILTTIEMIKIINEVKHG